MEDLNRKLYNAARDGDVNVVQDCLQKGADVHNKNDLGRTPLHRAAEMGYTDVTKVLLEAGASLSVVDKEGYTPLHWAAEKGNTDVTKVLLEAGASLSAVNKEGYTPLHWAAWRGNTDVTKVLLEAGASLSAVDNVGKTHLHWAAEMGNTDVTKVLLEAGASLSAVDKWGYAPLHWAAWRGNTDVTKVLLEAGASLSAVDDKGYTPLHWAAEKGNTDVTKVLLEAGASLSAVNKKGRTPLHLAARAGQTDVTKVLLEEGASLSAVDNMGKTPHDLAHGNVKKLLQEYMDKVHTMDMPSNTDEKVTQFPMMGTSDEIKELLSEGTFISYENCVYLGGACNVGKSTLASILIGEKIPQEWKPTDGLTIYFGRNGIDLKNKEMVPLKQGSDGDVLSKVLRGKPDMTQEKPDTVPQSTDQSTAPTSSLVPEKDDVNIKQKSLQNYKIATILGDIKEEIRKGTYKIEIAPSDLVDFGGQRSFDMTHQLFMRFKGTFVLMFNGQIDFSVPLKEYEEGETTEAILKHWVNSILSYCVDDKDILPIIMFCATHRDHYKTEKNHEARRKKLIHGLREIFQNHKLQHRIIYDDIFFINGMDKDDLEINRLKSKLVEVAFKQESWGKRMPMALVPLELQMSQMRLHNKNIISKEELTTLNQGNEDLALTVEQIKYFLNVQHSLGKILYFDQHGLDNFIVVQPQSLVNILRSFITDELFWPKDMELRGILDTLTKTGKIAKQDLLKLWLQGKFHQHMPNDDFKEFIIQFLVHLHILVEPKHRQEQESKVQSYFVPCIVKRRLPVHPDFYVKSADKMICLSYTLLKSSIPAALSFKLIGAAMNVWPLKETLEGICLYHQAAILCIDESNELHLLVEDDKVFVYLINEKNKGLISPNTAFTVQERLTLAMTKVLEFYHKSFGKSLSTSEASKVFEIEVGEWCTSGGGCYISVPEVKKKTEWICKNNRTHQTKYPHYWIFDKLTLDNIILFCSKSDTTSTSTEAGTVYPSKASEFTSAFQWVKELGLETVDEFKNMLKEGSYACYWNRIYLVGPFGVGKTTLAKNLVGDDIPESWDSTDGIWIYMGRAGMDTEQRKWVFLDKGTHLNAAVMSMLKTKRSKTSVSEEVEERYSKDTHGKGSKTSVSEEVEERYSEGTHGNGSKTSISEEVEGEDTHADEDPNEHDDHQTHDSSSKLPDTKSDINTERTHIPTDSNNDISDDEIISLVLQECKKHDYKMIIIPIDIWDFGGQKIYYMTHQLFISSMGTYVVVFKGSIDINVEVDNLTILPGHKGKKTSAAYLMHWVNSILTYCKKSKTNKGVLYPRILFVATHKDKVDKVEEQKQLLKASLENLFEHHAGREHLVIDQLFFINATDKQDKDIEELRQMLLDAAFEHPNWGQPMPTKFVPLEIQLAKQSSEGKKVLSMTELEIINRRNDNMALTIVQLNTFLKIAHASGKLIHFDDEDLREYVIVDPTYLIEVLRSIVTEKLFCPKSETLRNIFEQLSTTGIIYKSDLLRIWEQTDFMHIYPYKEYMINILVRLDIMIQPKSDVFDNEGNPPPSTDNEYFLVPCMITERPLPETFGNDKCIYMSYMFKGQIVPPAFLYRFLASFVAMRNINVSKDLRDLLFTDSAVVSIDKDHKVKAHVQDNRLVVTLMHVEDKTRIVPSIAATVQESLARNIERTYNFYYAITNTSNDKETHPFLIEFGVYCQSQLCFFEHNQRPAERLRRWRCPEHDIDHDTTLQYLWFAEKEPTIGGQCHACCTGLEMSWLQKFPSDKHIRRLAASLTDDQTRELYLHCELYSHSSQKWKNMEYQYSGRDLDDMHFFALLDWKRNYKNPTFGELLRLLKKVEVNTCVLCEVVWDIHLPDDYSEEMLSWTPSDEALEDLCHTIGSATLQLGIELELDIVTLQSIEIKHKKDLINQTRSVLKKWKSDKCSNKEINYPLKTLAKSLKRVGRLSSIEYLDEHFKLRSKQQQN